MVERQVHECAFCAYQCSVTAGTIFHKTRTPLSSWFWAIYCMSHDKKGISAMQLAKKIGVSYPTAWLMLHKIRKAMSDRDQRFLLDSPIQSCRQRAAAKYAVRPTSRSLSLDAL
jgi:transposase-like protein